jgi:hypothetical protein
MAVLGPIILKQPYKIVEYENEDFILIPGYNNIYK